MNVTIHIDTSQAFAKLRRLRADVIPTAARNALRDTARDVVAREKLEISNVFKGPVPLIQNSPRVEKRAEKTDLTTSIWLKDVYKNKYGIDIVKTTLSQHIPGHPETRHHKGMESWLIRKGYMTASQWLMPTRNAPLDANGNIPGSVATKMLADIGVFPPGGAGLGWEGNTKRKPIKWIWRSIDRGGKKLQGIWSKDMKLAMVVVNKTPTYGKRFHFKEVGLSWASKRLPEQIRISLAYHLGRGGGA